MENQKFIRNFAIIAHIDHGKSTLSDRLLEITKTVAKDKLQEQFLDQNPISRKRGITIKLAPVRMKYTYSGSLSPHPSLLHPKGTSFSEAAPQGEGNIGSTLFERKQGATYTLNLIDTPGHVDFSYEVSRTLAACEGAVILVDATQGIQAQTMAHFMTAKKLGLVMIPAINKIDLPNAQTEIVIKEMVEIMGFQKDEIILLSAKTGENVEILLQRVVEKIPSPAGDPTKPLRALIFDAVYDEYQGVVTYVRIMDGALPKGMKVQLFQSGVKADVTEVGYFSPFLVESPSLECGEIGYVITAIKDIRQTRVGDTIMDALALSEPLPGYILPQPMIFFGMYPRVQEDFAKLRESLGKLTLNDTALSYTEEYSAYLGSGFRVGFLGLLHADIVKERLKQEFGLDLLLTMPQVLYEKMPDGSIKEPYMMLTIYVPIEYVGGVMTVCQKKKGNLLDLVYHDAYAVITYDLPYTMFIRGLSAELKSITAGFASIDYELLDYRDADLVQLDIRINDVVIDVLSEYVYKDEAVYIAREKAAKLKETLNRQQFRQIIQAAINGNILAREEISPYRKDVLAKMSGGDRTRKDKLLEAQKKGKSRMISHGKVELSQEALFSLIES